MENINPASKAAGGILTLPQGIFEGKGFFRADSALGLQP